MIDKQPAGPEIITRFPFELNGTAKELGILAEIRGNEINYLRYLNEDEHVFISELQGFGNEVKDYDISIENQRSGAGVRMTANKPIEKMVFWCSSTTYCPEPYIHIIVDPGQEFKWKIFYEFYEIPEGKNSL